MGKIIFFTGGARSGKSKFAEEYTKDSKYSDKIYIATAIPFDEEMKDRVAKHIKRRGKSWTTIEAYKNLVFEVEKKIKANSKGVILFDCLTNMVTNLMIMDREIDWDKVNPEKINELENEIIEEVNKFLIFLKNIDYDCVFVTNELGMSLVPEYPLGRFFRDICGNVNQLVAKNSDEAYLVVSGIKIQIK